MKQFSVLFADDEGGVDNIALGLYRELTSRGHPADAVQLTLVRDLMPGYESKPTEIAPGGVIRVVNAGQWSLRRITEADVLVLDLAMGWHWPDWARALNLETVGFELDKVEKENGISATLNGYSFVRLCGLKLRARHIIFISAHASDRNVKARVLSGQASLPGRQVLLFDKTEANERFVIAKIATLCDEIRSGFTRSQNDDAIEFAAFHDEPVLIVGESGTGKERIARSIHARWAAHLRTGAPEFGDVSGNFAVVNCGGMSPELAQSELFGHVKGAFTGAHVDKLGKLLWACGCREISAIEDPASSRPGDLHNEIEQHLAAARNAGEVVKSFKIGDDPSRLLDTVRGLVAILTKYLADRRSTTALINLVERASQKLQANLQTSGSAHSYRRGLLAVTQGKPNEVEEHGRDLRFRHSGPFGTVFFDEFGDLPLDVQTLLLRYAQDYEVQPLGFAGVIRGARVRIIAATSDPRIARFAGQELTGAGRSSAENMRPLRLDLLFRFKGQVIRAAPVTGANVEEVLDELIEHAEPMVAWSEAAKSYLVDEVRKLLGRMDGPDGAAEQPAFGHMRELSRTVRLANRFVSTATARGHRRTHAEVRCEDVQFIWTPPHVLSPTAAPRHRSPVTEVAGAASTKTNLAQLVDPNPTNAGQRAANLVVRALMAEVRKSPASARYALLKKTMYEQYNALVEGANAPFMKEQAFMNHLSAPQLQKALPDLSAFGFDIDAAAGARRDGKIHIMRNNLSIAGNSNGVVS